jgi:hypothetical protein
MKLADVVWFLKPLREIVNLHPTGTGTLGGIFTINPLKSCIKIIEDTPGIFSIL